MVSRGMRLAIVTFLIFFSWDEEERKELGIRGNGGYKEEEKN